jgi:hypothetical protein
MMTMTTMMTTEARSEVSLLRQIFTNVDDNPNTTTKETTLIVMLIFAVAIVAVDHRQRGNCTLAGRSYY